MAEKRLIVGISGASGAPLAIELLRQIHRHPEIKVHLIVTKGGELTLKHEANMTPSDLHTLVDMYHNVEDIGASIASGSFRTMGMIVVPCSMKTVAGIASGYSDNLLLRAADVCLKEQRKLVLAVRESPFSTLHLRNLYEVSKLGAVVIPPMLTYYHHPQSVEDCTHQAANRILAQFDLDEGNDQWRGMDASI